jgi:hypothetical protein
MLSLVHRTANLLVTLGGPWYEVVGVAENVYADGVNRPAPATVYFRSEGRGVTFAIRSKRAGSESFLWEIGATIHAANPSLPLAKVRTLNEVYSQSMARTSFSLVLLGIAGMMALSLAIIGVYGVLAYALGQRRREVSIRLFFIRKGLMLNCLGAGIGLALAGALSHWISSLLCGVTALDPVTYLVSGGLIGAAAITASYVPARQAASVDPMETLRSE